MAMTDKEMKEGMQKKLEEEKKKEEAKAKTPLGAMEAMKKRKKETEEALKY